MGIPDLLRLKRRQRYNCSTTATRDAINLKQNTFRKRRHYNIGLVVSPTSHHATLIPEFGIFIFLPQSHPA